MPFYKGRNWENLPDDELVWAHFQCHRAYGLWKKYGKYTDSEGYSWSKEDFYNQHLLIVQEMRRRGMKVDPNDELLKIGPKAGEIEMADENNLMMFLVGAEKKPIADLADGVMLNAVQIKERKQLAPWVDDYEGKLMLDNGIFGDTVLDVKELANRTNAIVPDIVCGPDVLYDKDIHKKSLKRQKEFLGYDLPEETEVMLIPQGNTCLDFEWCIEQILEMKPEWIGLGRMSMKVAGYPGRGHSQRVYCLNRLEELELLDRIHEEGIKIHSLGISKPFEFRYLNKYGFKAYDSMSYIYSSIYNQLVYPYDPDEKQFSVMKNGAVKRKKSDDDELYKAKVAFVEEYPQSASLDERQIWIIKNIWRPMMSQEATDEHVQRNVESLSWEDRDDEPVLEKPGKDKLKDTADMSLRDKRHPIDLRRIDSEQLDEDDVRIYHLLIHRLWEREPKARGEGVTSEELFKWHREIVAKMKDYGIEHNSPLNFRENSEFAPVAGSGEVMGREIELEEVLKCFEEFRPVWPYVYLVGGLVNRGKTQGDIDIFIRSQEQDPINVPIKFRIYRMLPKEFWSRIQWLHVDTTDPYPHVPGPYTNNVPLFGMQLHAIKPFETVEMELASVKPGKFFTPLKPTIGYKKGVVYGWDALKINIDEDLYPVFVQKKYDGARVQIHKKGSQVRIYSDSGKRIEHRLPSFVEELQSEKWPKEVVLDAEAEMWENREHQGREVVSGFLNKRKELRPGDDKDIVLNVFDVLYTVRLGSLHDWKYEERLRALDKLPIGQSTDKIPKTGKFNTTPSYRAKNDGDMIKASRKVSKLPGSEGAMIKGVESKYDFDGETDQWFKYKTTAEFVVKVLEKLKTRTEGVFNYRMGAKPHEDYEIDQSDLKEVGGETYVYIGKTMNTSISVGRGAKLRVTAENLFVYKDRVRLYLPVVLEAKKAEEVQDLETMVEIAKEAGLVQKKGMASAWPEEGKRHPFVIQIHFRGKSAHHDFRAKVNDKLEGWTVYSQPAGKVKQEPVSVAEARRVAKKIKWKWPRTDVHAQAGSKAPQPTEWLKVEGKFEPGEVGTTKEKPGFMIIIDEGRVEFGARKSWFYEYFLHGKNYKGRLIFRFIPRRQSSKVVEGPTNEVSDHHHWVKIGENGKGMTTIEGDHFHEVEDHRIMPANDHTHDIEWKEMIGVGELQDGRTIGYWNTWLPKDQEPYVLSRGAESDNWIPPKNVSALPADIRKKIPEKYRYWKFASRAERIKVRNALRKAKEVEFSVLEKFDREHWLVERDGRKFLASLACQPESDIVTMACMDSCQCIDLQRKEFKLKHHWWKGQAVVRSGPSVEHWDLMLGENKMFVLNGNPTEGAVNASEKKPYVKSWWDKGDDESEFIKPGEPGNPTKDTPAWVETVDEGEITVLEDGNMFKRFNFNGKKLKGTYVMDREDADINLWEFRKAKSPGEKKMQVKLEAGQMLKQQNIKLSVSGFKWLNGQFVVSGSALSYGVWNGDWYPPEVLDDRPERVLEIPVGVGSHKDKTNVGQVIDYRYDKDTHTIEIDARIDDKKKQNQIEDGEFVGFSVEITVMADETRNIIQKIISYDRVVVVKNPACEVCTIDNI